MNNHKWLALKALEWIIEEFGEYQFNSYNGIVKLKDSTEINNKIKQLKNE